MWENARNYGKMRRFFRGFWLNRDGSNSSSGVHKGQHKRMRVSAERCTGLYRKNQVASGKNPKGFPWSSISAANAFQRERVRPKFTKGCKKKDRYLDEVSGSGFFFRSDLASANAS